MSGGEYVARLSFGLMVPSPNLLRVTGPLALLAVLLSAGAGWGAEPGHPVIAYRSAALPAVHLTIPADYVARKLEIRSTERDEETRNQEVREARALIYEALEEDDRVFVRRGEATSDSRSWKTAPETSVELYLFARIDEGSDGFAAARLLWEIVDSVELPGKARAKLDGWRLAVSDTSAYRNQLVQLIAQEVDVLRKTLGPSSSARVSGLENRVLARHLDDRRIQLYIDYRLEVELEE